MYDDSMYILAGSEELSRQFNDLGSDYSDFYKEIHGTRPRFMALCACDYPDRASLVEAMSHLKRQIDGLHQYMDAVKSTFAGRERLRDEVWYIEETDPQYIAAAAESEALRKAERDRLEYECSWEYHLEQQAAREAAAKEQAENDHEAYFYDKYEAVR